MPLDDFYHKIVAIQEFDIVAETMAIINKESDVIKSLLTGQLARGKDGNKDNVTIFGRDYYTDATVLDKERHGVGFGKFTGWITNYFSGTFYNSLSVETSGEVFEVKGEVDYFPEIIRRSGSVIMELDSDSLEIFSQEFLIPQLQERFSLVFNGV